ncbi:MAG: PCRF domain-containing protein, partial [Actinobacteria bacterium]|nr:PCRF domain-containing protein [Actinomycetota bacterium]
MADRDFPGEISALEKTLAGIESVLNLPELERRSVDLEAKASAPDLWNDPERAQKVTSELSRTQSTINKVKSLKSRVVDLPVMLELAASESDQSAMSDFSKEVDSVTKAVSDLEVQTLLSGEYDHRDALITIRSEAGGVDAADWAEMVSRMFFRYCERHSLSVSVLETSYAEEAGIKSTTFKVSGPYAYGNLSVEQGTHRLVR